jgi:hypothetical protein
MVRTEGENLQALWPGLEGTSGRGRYANGVLRADVEDLVVELDSRPLPQAKVRDTGALSPERLARDACFPAVAETVPRSLRRRRERLNPAARVR